MLLLLIIVGLVGLYGLASLTPVKSTFDPVTVGLVIVGLVTVGLVTVGLVTVLVVEVLVGLKDCLRALRCSAVALGNTTWAILVRPSLVSDNLLKR